MNRTKNLTYYLAALVTLATFIVYLRALHNGFVVLDDNAYVYENPHIRSFNLTFLRWAFLDYYASNWHPLTWLSHALDYAVWGLNPLGHHLTNIIAHAINTFAVVCLAAGLIEVFQQRIPEGRAFRGRRKMLVAAGITGILFGLHPLHVESVAWVAERKDLLCVMFFLLSLISYVKHMHGAAPARNDPHHSEPSEETGQAGMTRTRPLYLSRYYLLALCFFVLALMSKPMAVTLPLVLLIVDWYPFNRVSSLKTLQSVLAEKLPFFALSLISSILTIQAQSASGAIVPVTFTPLSTRLIVAAHSLVAYLGKMVIPLNLVPYYPYPENASFFSLQYFSAVVLVIAITVICIFVSKRQRLWLSVWCYYVITLLPVMGLMQVGGQAMADRYTYLPSLGPFLIVGCAGAWFSERNLAVKSTGIAAGILIFVMIAWLTFRQISVWKNSLVVLNYILEKEPHNSPHVYLYRGEALEEAGRLEPALEDFNRAIALNPSYAEAYNSRGLLHMKRGQTNKAIEDFGKSISLRPSSKEFYFNLGTAFAETGLFDRAVETFNQSVTLDPAYADAYANRGITYALIGQQSRALEDFNKASELNNRLPGVYFNRGKLFVATGRKKLALEDFQKACALGDESGCNALNDLRRTVTEQGE